LQQTWQHCSGWQQQQVAASAVQLLLALLLSCYAASMLQCNFGHGIARTDVSLR
jgi:hypothetical protein